MLRNPESYKHRVEELVSEILQEGDTKHPARVRVTLFGNVEMFQDTFAAEAAEVLQGHNCVFTDNVCAIHDDDSGAGWTRVTFEFMQSEHIADYIQGVAKDHHQEVWALRVERDALQHELDGLTDLRPEN